MSSERGRVTRPGSSYTLDRHDYTIKAQDKHRQWTAYLNRLIEDLEFYFKPWPEWFQQCNIAFNFEFASTSNNRNSALEVLMNCPTDSHPLLQVEKDRLANVLLHLLLIWMKSKKHVSTWNPCYRKSRTAKPREGIIYKVTNLQATRFL